ncbi:MAG TPA: serine/threonine-protein kinase, partial [Myxococcales bacterium]|nr:serine/threonine-protein kinase [Myxococcales bacterium]
MSTAPQQQQPPKLGKYLLLKKLGGGGMGRVYLASMSGPMAFEKKVVVKTILPSFTENKDYVQLFLNEARLGARLSHSAIASIHELGEENGLYYLVMEYVDGWTLRQAIKAAQKENRTLNPARVAEIFARVCEGLFYAHTLLDKDGKPLGVVHRDLSPQNIMISREGDVKVIDFGVARSDLSTNETVAGTIKGKLSYMSPEQSRGERVDARSDIFALGVLLYEALTNTNPFDRDSPLSILRALETLEPVPLAKLDQNLGPFDPIIRKCLQKDRDRRYPDCRELRMDLLAVLERQRASQRDHLGSWVASILERRPGAADGDGEGSALSTGGGTRADKTLVEPIDPFAGPHDPGTALPEPEAPEEPEPASAAEQATRLKPIEAPRGAGGTVVRGAPVSVEVSDDAEAVSHVSGLRTGPSRTLLGVGAAMAVVAVGGGALWFMNRKPAQLPDSEPAPVADAPAQNPPLPAPAPTANPAANPTAAPTPTPTANPTAAANPAATPTPTANPAATPTAAPTPDQAKPAVAEAPPPPTPEPDAVPTEVAAAEPIAEPAAPRHHHHHKEASAEAAPAEPAPSGNPGGLMVRAIGDTHASDAYGNPLNPHRSLGSSANLQVGALQVHLQALLADGVRT